MRIKTIILSAFLIFSSLVYAGNTEAFSLTVKVDGLRNSKGVVQFALYNKNGSIPDQQYKKYYKMKTAKINNGSASVVFKNLPKGRYAVNALHDENMNGKIDKGFILPTEGIGFTNYSSIGLRNRPDFLKASFIIATDDVKSIKIIYF